MRPKVRLLTGDAYQLLNALDPGSVDVCWCSPNPPGMFEGPEALVGTEDTMGEYIQHLVAIFHKVGMVLKRTGSLWVRIGDYHNLASGFLNCAPARLQLELHRHYWLPMGQISWIRDDEDYIEVPGQEYKPPTDRFLRNVEYMQWYTKQPKGYYFNNKDIAGTDINLRSDWHYHYKYYIDKPSHIPHEIVKYSLWMTCPRGGTVLDPFHGRGTTMIVALKQGLNYIGIELLPSRVRESIEKIKQFDGVEVSVS